MGKAVKKVKSVLPASPRKREAVVKQLLFQIQPATSKASTFATNSARALTKEEQKKIVDFYLCDDISRQAPGKRDTKSVKNVSSGKREVFQKRHMVMAVKEAFVLYKDEYPDCKIHISKFYSMRPQHVLLSSETPHNVCVCKYHANFNFIVETLHELIPIFPATGKELLEHICCNTQNEVCMYLILILVVFLNSLRLNKKN